MKTSVSWVLFSIGAILLLVGLVFGVALAREIPKYVMKLS